MGIYFQLQVVRNITDQDFVLGKIAVRYGIIELRRVILAKGIQQPYNNGDSQEEREDHHLSFPFQVFCFPEFRKPGSSPGIICCHQQIKLLKKKSSSCTMTGELL